MAVVTVAGVGVAAEVLLVEKWGIVAVIAVVAAVQQTVVVIVVEVRFGRILGERGSAGYFFAANIL